jgi:hypothetical protein
MVNNCASNGGHEDDFQSQANGDNTVRRRGYDLEGVNKSRYNVQEF